MKSNIVAGSNVFLSRTDDPMQDPAFVAQVQDYLRLQEIATRKLVIPGVASFDKVQESILKTELRCVYAKSDPCWGYRKDLKRVVSACINGKCPDIYKCNPSYTTKEAAYWVTSDKERELYGWPDKQRVYYIVDMISDEEMNRYFSDPVNEGYEYPIPKNPVLINEQDMISKKEVFKIDPKTGRKMVIVGYRWLITDNASYENEDLIPIWDYVDEVEVKRKERAAHRKKAKRIEKKPVVATLTVPQIINRKDEDPDYARKEEFEKSIASHVAAKIKLTDLDNCMLAGSDTVILLDNPAELGFVSNTFLVSGVEHGINVSHNITLALVDDYLRFTSKTHVMISNTVIKVGCKKSNVQAWKRLAEEYSITLLNITARDYYAFSFENKKERWTCRNMYGVTHICIVPEDIATIEVKEDGLYPARLVEDKGTYLIQKKDGTLLGLLDKEFTDVIRALKDEEEIYGLPAEIQGLALRIQNGKPEILGMGHLRFDEY